MWSNWAEKATEALEKTGDALTRAATNAGKSARNKQHQQQSETDAAVASGLEAPSPRVRYDAQPTIAQLPPDSNKNDRDDNEANKADFFMNFNALSQGWSNVVETTKQSMKHAEQNMKEGQQMLREKILARAMPKKRDPSLPLDIEALKDAEVVYITDRIITMGHPASTFCLFLQLSCDCHRV
jgi:hypothetical protein